MCQTPQNSNGNTRTDKGCTTCALSHSWNSGYWRKFCGHDFLLHIPWKNYCLKLNSNLGEKRKNTYLCTNSLICSSLHILKMEGCLCALEIPLLESQGTDCKSQTRVQPNMSVFFCQVLGSSSILGQFFTLNMNTLPSSLGGLEGNCKELSLLIHFFHGHFIFSQDFNYSLHLDKYQASPWHIILSPKNQTWPCICLGKSRQFHAFLDKKSTPFWVF